MMPSTLAAIAALQLAQAVSAPPDAMPKRLIATGDHVKVRATPTADGQLVGYLFKNMVVEVLERGPRPEFVGYNSGYWYRVARGSLTGWAFGSFFSATLPPRPIDTYDLPDLNAWWGNRFGWSTEYYEGGAIPEELLAKLEMDDYRGLILMAKRGGEFGRYAWTALRSTLYPFLKKHPDDPKWQYLRDRAWDPAFIANMLEYYPGEWLTEALPDRLLGDPGFKKALCARAAPRYCTPSPAPAR